MIRAFGGDRMLTYLLFAILLGGSLAGWMGYNHSSNAKALRRRMRERNAYYNNLRLAKKTSASLKDNETGEETQHARDD